MRIPVTPAVLALALGIAIAPVRSQAIAAALAAAADNSPAFSDQLPEPLVRVPFPDRPAGTESGPPQIVQVLVGADGFVQRVRFVTTPGPADSVEIAARLRKWILRPGRGEGGRAQETWVAVPLPRSGRQWLARPDSLLRARLHPATAMTAYRLLPPTRASLDSVLKTGRKPVLFSRHWVLGAQPDSTGELAAALAALLADPAAYTGPDPVATRCFPEPALGIDIPGVGPDGWSQALVSFGCGFLQLTTPEAVLHVPFGAHGGALRAVAARMFPGDPAFAARRPAR